MTIIFFTLEFIGMKRLKLIIEYDGTDFYGWQVQPHRRSVQGEIEEALRTIYEKEIRVEGAGRTDRGVHAYGQVASLYVPEKLNPPVLKDAINGNIGSDIFIKECTPVPSDFHARFSAKSRIYQYQIYNGKSVFRRRYYHQINERLDIPLVKEAAEKLIGERDFTHLATKDKGICDLNRIDIKKVEDTIYLTLEADHFLRRMVRGIVGLLVVVGKGKFHPEEVLDMVSGKIRRPPVAPPEGLFLSKVIY